MGNRKIVTLYNAKIIDSIQINNGQIFQQKLTTIKLKKYKKNLTTITILRGFSLEIQYLQLYLHQFLEPMTTT